MQLQANQIALPYCPSHLKAKEFLSRVCINPNCPSNNLICFLCVNQKHKDHNTVSLAQFTEQLDNCKYDNSIVELINEKKRIIKGIQTKLEQSTMRFLQNLKRILNKTQEQTNDYFEDITDKLDSAEKQYLRSIPEPLNVTIDIDQFLTESAMCIQKFKSFEHKKKLIEQSIELNLDYIDKLESRHNTLLKIMEDLFCEQNSLIKKTISEPAKCEEKVLVKSEQLVKSDGKIQQKPGIRLKSKQPQKVAQQKQPFDPLKPLNKSTIRWCQNLKHQNISVSDAEVTIKSNYKSYVCILSENILNHKQVSWAIRVGKINWGTILGIAQQGLVIDNKFQYKGWGPFGQGHYMVNSRGQAYDGTNNKKNDKKYSFEEGDRLTFKYDPTNKLLIITKNGIQHCEFKIKEPKNSYYRVCAYLRDSYSSIELVDFQ